MRALRTYGTSANLRASLADFSASGGNVVSFVGSAQARIQAIAGEFDGLQVSSPDRLVARCLTIAGESMLPLADAVQERESLNRIARELHPSSPFYASREFPGFGRRLAATLRELRSDRLTADAMRELSTRAEPYLALKLDSLAKLEDGLRAGLRRAAREVEAERFERCLSAQLPAGFKGRLWAYTGGEYSPLVCDWLIWASRQGYEIWLVADGHPQIAGHCQGAERTVAHLGVEAPFSGRANGLAERLFSDQPALEIGLDVDIVSASDPLAEVEWALRSIAEEVQGGMKWNSAAIYVRSFEEYAPLLQFAAERFAIPIRLPQRERLANNPWIRLVVEYLGAVAADSPRHLADLTANSYLFVRPFAEEQRREIGLASVAEDPWLSLRERLDAADEAHRWLADAGRLHAKSEMGDLGFLEWLEEFTDLVEGPWLGRALAEDGLTSRRDVAARSALLHALEPRAVIAEAFGDVLSLGEFVGVLRELTLQTDYGYPPADEGVSIVSHASALGHAEYVVVLGMIEGAFPRRRSEDPILSDLERAAIDAMRKGVPALRSSHEAARAERDELVRLCAAASRRVSFFYPQVGDDRDNTPAFYLHEIERVAGATLRKVDLAPTRFTPPSDECLLPADAELCDALQFPKEPPADPNLLTQLAREAVAGLPEDGLSPSDLRTALICPFQFQFSRRLRLKRNSAFNAWRRLRWLPDSVTLVASESPAAAREALANALEAELEALGPESIESDRRLLETGGRREIVGFVEREFLAREIWPKKPESQVVGVAFGEAGTADELPCRGKSVKIRGRFAAVSEIGDYLVGHLYGGRDFGVSVRSGSANMEKIEDPNLLELGIHLWSLCRRKPAVALQVDTAKGERLLMMLPKPEFDLESRTGQNLRVVDLGDKAEFFERVKALLAKAVSIIESGEIAPTPGDHCQHCDFGELCRRAKGFGEGFDPFAREASGDE